MKLRLIALASASLIALVTPAAAGDGWYLGLGAGWSKMDELKYQRAIPGGKFKFDDAARFDAAAGYKWASGLRLELEDGYASYKVSSATTPAGALIAGATGHVSVGTVMGVVAYDIPIAPEFAFTIGAGAGAGRVLAAYRDPTETNRKGKTAFAYQAIAGIIWSVSSQVDLQLDYRYVSVAKTTHAFNSPVGVAAGTVSYGNANAHNIMLNIRWFFQP